MGQPNYNLIEYVAEHRERQSNIGRSNAGFPATNIDQLLKYNKNRIYVGVHESCASETKIITCAIFKGTKDYFHTLYLGHESDKPNLIHQKILNKLNISEEEFLKNKSIISLS